MNQEIKDRIDTWEQMTRGKPHHALYQAVVVIKEQQTIIDQQSQELGKLQEELTAIRPLVDLRMHDDKDSLELAVKVLEEILELRGNGKDILFCFGEATKIVDSTLDQIRGEKI